MMHVLFDPHDWFGRHPRLCMSIVVLLIFVGGFND